jgi:uncharacterized lipoprotein YajG
MKAVLILLCAAVIFFALHIDMFAQCANGRCGVTKERTMTRSTITTRVAVIVVPPAPADCSTGVCTPPAPAVNACAPVNTVQVPVADRTQKPVRHILASVSRAIGKVAKCPFRLFRRR